LRIAAHVSDNADNHVGSFDRSFHILGVQNITLNQGKGGMLCREIFGRSYECFYMIPFVQKQGLKRFARTSSNAKKSDSFHNVLKNVVKEV
jgi:hypothetical protein